MREGKCIGTVAVQSWPKLCYKSGEPTEAGLRRWQWTEGKDSQGRPFTHEHLLQEALPHHGGMSHKVSGLQSDMQRGGTG